MIVLVRDNRTIFAERVLAKAPPLDVSSWNGIAIVATVKAEKAIACNRAREWLGVVFGSDIASVLLSVVPPVLVGLRRRQGGRE